MNRFGLLLVCSLTTSAVSAGPARADHDPANTATIYVHGFDFAGASRSGTYGDVNNEPVADSIAALAGLPVSHGGDGPLPPNVAIGVGYYGDTPPAWYTAADRADVDAVTATWGGGVPRYALIVAKFARHVMQRSGATQVNFVSASFGSLAVRWLIEKNVEGLAGDGRIARWLTIEGVIGGSWAASHVPSFLDFLTLASVDLVHMSYPWIEANVHDPRDEADSPWYANILIGQVGSTDDRYREGALSLAMASERDWHPNDGVQALPDVVFRTVTAPSRLEGLGPTLGLFDTDHFGLEQLRGAWAEAATFITQRRRVTVTLTSATVSNTHEPKLPLVGQPPGRIVFESRVRSPEVARRWGITDPLCSILESSGAAPLVTFDHNGDTHALQHVIFDDFVLPSETELDLDLRAFNVEYDPHYGIYETVKLPYLDDLGGATIAVSTIRPGSYAFHAADWSGQVAVTITDYPFAAVTAVAGGPAPVPSLSLAPNPTRGPQRIVAAGLGDASASLEIMDISGRWLRRATVSSEGFVWDGRDAAGRPVPPGVYLVRVLTPRGSFQARSCVIR